MPRLRASALSAELISSPLSAATVRNFSLEVCSDSLCAGPADDAARAALARVGQRLSLDPPGDPTIGACLAGNRSGPLRHRFGAPRDLVLGVSLVRSDGTAVRGSQAAGARGSDHAVNDEPQPQAATTLGLLTWKPAPWREST